MTFLELAGLGLLLTGLLIMLVHRRRARQDRDRPNLGQALFASHLSHRVFFSRQHDPIHRSR